MSRVLLADDSPHAQRMGERILREEGYEVVTVTDGQTALIRLADVDPDVVFADVSLPRRSGYEICQEIKNDQRFSHVRVVLTAGLLKPLDEKLAASVACDGILKKPFESSAMIQMVRAMTPANRSRVETVQAESEGKLQAPPAAATAAPEESESRLRPLGGLRAARHSTIPSAPVYKPAKDAPLGSAAESPPQPEPRSAYRSAAHSIFGLHDAPVLRRAKSQPEADTVAVSVPETVPVRTAYPNEPSSLETAVAVRVMNETPDAQVDPERVRAAVTVALDAAWPALLDKITEQVLIALKR